ncbi:hypothetical protein F4777DRAFT_512025 [Nemania sp. FL0916]|nr:hypothetical protein F4777DRAFT_512025 [Nemania sp. FL0916]
MKLLLVLLISTTAAVATAPAPASVHHEDHHHHQSCDRALLREATRRYIAAQSTGQIQWLSALLSPNATLVENNAEVAFANSLVLNKALALAHVRHIYDEVACASFSELVSLSPGAGYQIGTQLRFDAPIHTPRGRDMTGKKEKEGEEEEKLGENVGEEKWEKKRERKIVKIDSIITTTNSLYFNATHALHYILLEDWSSPLPPHLLSSRTALRAAADAYYASFDLSLPTPVTVPWGKPCDRLEGGAYMGQGLANDTCDAGLPPFSVEMRERRYVIDERAGAVNILSEFGILGPDSHEFRVEGGKIRWIHAMTYCRGAVGCNAPEFPGLEEDVGW